MDLACSNVELTKNSTTLRLAKTLMSAPAANVTLSQLNARTVTVVSTARVDLVSHRT